MSRVKHLFAVVLAALMLCLLMPVAAFAEEASDGKMIYYNVPLAPLTIRRFTVVVSETVAATQTNHYKSNRSITKGSSAEKTCGGAYSGRKLVETI